MKKIHNVLNIQIRDKNVQEGKDQEKAHRDWKKKTKLTIRAKLFKNNDVVS